MYDQTMLDHVNIDADADTWESVIALWDRGLAELISTTFQVPNERQVKIY